MVLQSYNPTGIFDLKYLTVIYFVGISVTFDLVRVMTV